MAEGHREQIMAALQGVLGSMTDEMHWGETLDPAPVCEREYHEPTQAVRFPHLIVEEGDGSIFGAPGAAQSSEGYGVTPGVGYEDRIVADVYCWVLGGNGVPTGTWLNRMWWEVLLRLKRNRTLGGLANEVHPFGPARIIDLPAQPRVAAVMQSYQITVNPVPVPVEG